ncbi:Thiol-disulfide oxidoreductase D [Thalassovita gelatinovora]|uniref:Thiol-disulfide oxidoreductase D n=1 Tax=Thalassovita gelatinovora TaxID=53501 RepID=A0A0P1F9V2_THAGE|nr:DsbA family protein [Thalassovita gelatinovora]QIZ81288.1 DsbA family protein [Thalassovita gelatinovora]CUH64566.1 Thiol-disulfide oxidoreductase D [Thalassovita gelatinovora]SEP95973.1 Protein-disulfide isomerase [Thalassovita gelatinovora]
MNRRYALGLIGAAAVTAGALSLVPRSSGLADFGAAYAAGEDVDTSSIQEMVLGAEDAPVTLIEYASFTCPHCATFNNGPLKKVKAEYIETGKVKLIYRDVYFDRPGLWAAMIARCDPNRFFGISDLLYTGQHDWIGDGNLKTIEQNLRKIGLVAGLTKDQLDNCLSDGTKAQSLYTWFQKNAETDDISGTPTLIINGEKHSNMTYEDLKEILDQKLEM